jgi:hypothetical protein
VHRWAQQALGCVGKTGRSRNLSQVRDPKFQDRVVAETRALLSTIPK